MEKKIQNMLVEDQNNESVTPKSSLTILGPSDMSLPSINVKGINEKIEKQDELMTFGNLIEKAEGVKSEQPKVESMKNALIQAIKTQDNEQLSAILHNTTINIVQKTVAGIPTTYVIPFLKYIISKFRSNPKFGLSLIIWMRVVLIQHTSFLMTIPELVKLLAELYTTIDTRVSVLDDMLKLQGRMDLLLSQINNKRDKQTFDTESVPLSVYNEEEEDSDDDIDETKNEKNNNDNNPIKENSHSEDSIDENNNKESQNDDRMEGNGDMEYENNDINKKQDKSNEDEMSE